MNAALVAGLVAMPFASTVGGQILLPVIGGLLVALIIYLVRKLGKLLTGIGEAADLAADVKVAQDAFKADVVSRLVAQDLRLAAIDAETRTNGGSSLKDATTRTELAVGELRRELSLHLEDAKYRTGKIDGYMAAHP